MLSAAVGLRFVFVLEGTEFSGGKITGPLLVMHGVGTLLFLLAVPVMYLLRRLASVIGLLACLLGLPLYVLLAAPGPFRWVVRGEWKTPLLSSFVWDWWSIVGIVFCALTAFAFLRDFAKAS